MKRPLRQILKSGYCIAFLGSLLTITSLQSSRAEPLLAVEDLQFKLVLGDGHILQGAELVGASFEIDGENGSTEIELASFKMVSSAINEAIPLYQLQVLGSDGSRSNYCQEDDFGRSQGFPYVADNGNIQIACTAGAIGKCVLWGLYPVQSLKQNKNDILQNSCTRMVRADYGGDGSSWTSKGIKIRFCDRDGIFPCPESEEWTYEASWSSTGATCVARVRASGKITLSGLADRYPGIENGPSCSVAGTPFSATTVLHSFIATND